MAQLRSEAITTPRSEDAPDSSALAKPARIWSSSSFFTTATPLHPLISLLLHSVARSSAEEELNTASCCSLRSSAIASSMAASMPPPQTLLLLLHPPIPLIAISLSLSSPASVSSPPLLLYDAIGTMPLMSSLLTSTHLGASEPRWRKRPTGNGDRGACCFSSLLPPATCALPTAVVLYCSCVIAGGGRSVSREAACSLLLRCVSAAAIFLSSARRFWSPTWLPMALVLSVGASRGAKGRASPFTI